LAELAVGARAPEEEGVLAAYNEETVADVETVLQAGCGCCTQTNFMSEKE